MSADNLYAVWKQNDEFRVAHMFMSPLDEDCMYLTNEEQYTSFDSREKAIVWAHDQVAKEYIVEYGVIDCGEANYAPCGDCWGCKDREERNRKMPN